MTTVALASAYIWAGRDEEAVSELRAVLASTDAPAEARALLELLWTDIALNWFPASQRLGGARSRDYDYLRGLGHLDVQMWVAGWLPGKLRGGANAIYPVLARWIVSGTSTVRAGAP